MNKKQKIFALLAVLSMGGSGVANAEPFNSYFSAQGALIEITGYDPGIAAVVTYGVRLPELDKHFSVEGEFTTSVVNPETTGFFGGTSEVSYFTLAGYGVYTHQLKPKLHLRGRVGYLYESLEVSTSIGDVSGTDTGLSFGAGITYTMSKESNFILEYTVIESDISHISAGLQFRL